MSSEAGPLALETLALALRRSKLEAVVIGNAASMLNGAPVTTQDIDLLLRDTKPNRRKLDRLAELLGGGAPELVSEVSRVEVIESTLMVPIELHYDRISGGLTFASVRSRAQEMTVGAAHLLVADLADVIRSKRAAGRPKDRAVLPILLDTLAVLNEARSAGLTKKTGPIR